MPKKKSPPIFTNLLIQVLAQGDAPFFPIRGLRPLPPPRWAAAAEARRQFQRSGVPWASRAATEIGRKAAQRALEQAAIAGMVKINRTRRVKTLSVKLTDRGEAHARAVADVGGELDAFLAMQDLKKFSKRPPAELPDAWVPETKLAGVEYDLKPHPEFGAVTEALLWAMVRQWVKLNCDADGRVYYRLTNPGWAQLETSWNPTEANGEDHNPDAAGLYDSALDSALVRLDTAPRGTDIGPIPLPVSMVRVPYPGPWGND